jgi:hypothetical protein
MKAFPDDSSLQNTFWFDDQYVDIKASPDNIFPWLQQMGNGRAGWYSYDLLDNFGKPSLKIIDPKLIQIEPGHKIPYGEIKNFESPNFITFQFGKRSNFTYLLEPINHDTTRVWSRLRVLGPSFLLNLTLKPAHTIMQNKQFKELKKRAEAQT